MAESQLGRQLGTAVQSALVDAADYLSLIIRTNPRGSASELIRRPDVDAVLRDALGQAQEEAAAAVEQAWFISGAWQDVMYQRLQGDLVRLFADLRGLRGLVLRAHASVLRREFAPRADEPGSHPSQRAAEERAGAVRQAVLSWARQAALRARMTLSSAEGLGATAAMLRDAREAGGRARKRWSRNPRSDSCIWCRRLDGVAIALRDSFAPYLGGPVALGQGPARHVATPAGASRYKLPVGSPVIHTHPPRLYHGDLQGPLLHPFCGCRLEIVRDPGTSATPWRDGQEDMWGRRWLSVSFLAASDVRAMAEDQYQADLAFLRAAVTELDEVLRRLAEGR